MKCLNSVQMMELLYGEADPVTLKEWRNHLTQCGSCREAFWQLKDSSDWVRKNDSTAQAQVIFIASPPQKRRFPIGLGAAAAVILAIWIGISASYFSRFQKQAETLVARQQQVEKKIQNTTLQVQDTNRNQYMMLLALKDYLDKNYQTRKVNYEKFR